MAFLPFFGRENAQLAVRATGRKKSPENPLGVLTGPAPGNLLRVLWLPAEVFLKLSGIFTLVIFSQWMDECQDKKSGQEKIIDTKNWPLFALP